MRIFYPKSVTDDSTSVRSSEKNMNEQQQSSVAWGYNRGHVSNTEWEADLPKMK
jgi:hypothetical protein